MIEPVLFKSKFLNESNQISQQSKEKMTLYFFIYYQTFTHQLRQIFR